MGYLFVAYKRTWRGTLVTSFVNPLFFLLAMGVGLGSVVDDSATSALNVPYLVFLAPALLASTALQTASVESAWPVFGQIKFTRTYHAMVSTPLRTEDVVYGQLGWVALRLLQTCSVYLLVMTTLGGSESWWVLLAVPAGVLTGMAFAAPLCAYSASIERETSLVAIQRFVVIPLFLFSGTFFPVSQLPGPLEVIAWVTPLWHGVELCRGVALQTLGAAAAAGHVAYLAAWVVAGVLVARRTLERKLVT